MRKTLMLAAGCSVAALALASALLADENGENLQTCVAERPDRSTGNVGFELIDLMRRQAWVTTDWTFEEYAKFSPGLANLNWYKNEPREGYAERASVLRSPGCENDGEFTYRTMFGRKFFHIANLTSLGETGGSLGNLRKGSVLKYHRLHFGAGQIVSFLRSPDGERYVRVNRPVGAAATRDELPPGWRLEDQYLTGAWTAELVGEVHVLRFDNGTSFQGPVTSLPATPE